MVKYFIRLKRMMDFYFLDEVFLLHFSKDTSEFLKSCGVRGILALLPRLVTRPHILVQERT